MADYLATEMLKYSPVNKNGESISILDPAAGKGELLVSMIKAIITKEKHIIAVGYETDETVAKTHKKILRNNFLRSKLILDMQIFLVQLKKTKLENMIM